MTDSRASQLQAMLVAQYVAQEGRADQLNTIAIGIFPSEEVRTSNLQTMIPLATSMDAEVTQANVMVVGQGRIHNRTMRAWSFSLDGHDFYCITLGRTATLVYDITTGKWSEWASPSLQVWRAHKGTNWVSINENTWDEANSNVVAGDDDFGRLWLVDPTIGYDQDPSTAEITSFSREIVGKIPAVMRETLRVNAINIDASMANPQVSGADIVLYTSDDNGLSWLDHGTITVEPGNFDQEFSWRSLGLVRAPGKLFRITDNGASVRIDNMEMR